jgi:hypothetical protein
VQSFSNSAEHRPLPQNTEIFQALLHFVKPKVLIAHGAGTRDTLGKLLGASLPAPPAGNSKPRAAIAEDMKIFIIPSLAPPKWNHWHDWAEQYLAKVAKAVASAL